MNIKKIFDQKRYNGSVQEIDQDYTKKNNKCRILVNKRARFQEGYCYAAHYAFVNREVVEEEGTAVNGHHDEH